MISPHEGGNDVCPPYVNILQKEYFGHMSVSEISF